MIGKPRDYRGNLGRGDKTVSATVFLPPPLAGEGPGGGKAHSIGQPTPHPNPPPPGGRGQDNCVGFVCINSVLGDARMWRTAPVILAVLTLGCGSKVNVESKFSLEPGGARILTVDPPKKEQRVRVEVSAAGKVNVVVTLSKNSESIERDLAKARPNLPPTALGGSQGKETADLTVTIPAGEEFVVWVQGAEAKPIDVTVKINSL